MENKDSIIKVLEVDTNEMLDLKYYKGHSDALSSIIGVLAILCNTCENIAEKNITEQSKAMIKAIENSMNKFADMLDNIEEDNEGIHNKIKEKNKLDYNPEENLLEIKENTLIIHDKDIYLKNLKEELESIEVEEEI